LSDKERIIALDIGSVRIGVAVSDPLGAFARGLTVLRASSDWMGELASIISEYGADTLLVGMPLRTDGTAGPEAERMKEVTASLGARFPDCRVIHWDERFTTVIASRALIDGDVSRKGRKGQVDKVAAAILLQSYLDFISRNERKVAGNINTAAVDWDLPGDRRKGRGRKSAYE
jgi:putative Holliday junction resolvase